MALLKNYIKEQVYVEVSGNIVHKGILVDIGTDIIVLFNGTDFLYIPLFHIQRLYEKNDDTADVSLYTEMPFDNSNEAISFRKILNNARGIFSEIYLSKNQTVHGYVVSIMNNYVVFYSPVFKTIYISLQHLKWLIPDYLQQAPFALAMEKLPVNPYNLPLSRTFEEQIKKLTNQIVVIDLGQDHNKVGQLSGIEDSIIEIITARQMKNYINIRHIKTIHLP